MGTALGTRQSRQAARLREALGVQWKQRERALPHQESRKETQLSKDANGRSLGYSGRGRWRRKAWIMHGCEWSPQLAFL